MRILSAENLRFPGEGSSAQGKSISKPSPAISGGNASWRTELVTVENVWDDLWIGVKGQSNLAIAGSPRNSFRASVICLVTGVELLTGLGDLQVYQTLLNSEYCNLKEWQSDYGR